MEQNTPQEAAEPMECERPAGAGKDAGDDTQDRRESDRTFSEAEVSAIVQRRLAREREKVDALVKGEFEQDLLAREKMVLAKELRAEGRERLAAAGLPGEGAQLLCCDSEEAFETSYKALVSLVGPLLEEAVRREVNRRFTAAGWQPRQTARADSADARLRAAFRPANNPKE